MARLVSILAHPFVSVSAMVLFAGLRLGSVASSFGSLALVCGFAMLPIAALMFGKVRAGHWQTVDASHVRDRPALYVLALVMLFALLAYLVLRRPGSFLVRGTIGALGLLLAAAVVNRRWKASLHMAFASLAATVLLFLGSPAGWVILAVLPLLGWSRLELSRHRPVELVVGCLLGVATGLAILFV